MIVDNVNERRLRVRQIVNVPQLGETYHIFDTQTENQIRLVFGALTIIGLYGGYKLYQWYKQ